MFVAIPKTGTHSVREALRPHLHARDWEQCLLFNTRLFPVPALASIPHGHLSCTQVRGHLHPRMWRGYFKFCIVRNPFDRFVSACCFVNRNNDRMRQDPVGTMKRTLENPRLRRHVLFRPQSEFVTDQDDELLVDYVGRKEDYQQHFNRICCRIGLPPQRLATVNATTRRPYQECYNPELIETVGQLYEKDERLFGYRFDPA